MSKSFKEDLTGQRFGRLTVLEFVPNAKENSYWRCKCYCGKIVIVNARGLKNGTTRSCGCLHKEKVYKLKTIHSLSKTRLYRIFYDMKARCYNFNNKQYKDYGGRGISVASEWKDDFKVFYAWSMDNGYTDELTIDRIDVNGNYEPKNCRWVDRKKQSRNTRKNIIIEYKGEKMCLKDVANIVGINEATLSGRYHRGDRGDRLFRPVDESKRKNR